MKRIIIFMSSFLLASCTSVNVPPRSVSSSVLPAQEVVKPLMFNPNVAALSAQLQNDYSTGQVQVLKIGNEVKITYSSDLLFGVSGEELLPDTQSLLDPLIAAIKPYPEAVVRVDSFTDKSGDAEKNFAHSGQRAQSIMRYCVANGVAVDKITGQGYAGSYPVASNDTAEGRALNRRVVITISKIPAPPRVT